MEKSYGNAQSPQGAPRPEPRRIPNYRQAPVVVFAEVTRACALACRHCRAGAQPRRNPLELTTQEWFTVVNELTLFTPKPILVLTGGDPLMRRDLWEVAAYALSQGLQTSLSPSVTALLTPKNLSRAAHTGVRHISLSLDGATPEIHDGLRGVSGSYERTVWALHAAQEAGLTVQVNTTVSRWNLAQLPKLADLVGRSRALIWDLFFLVPTGRAKAEEMLSPEQHEAVYQWLYDLSLTVAFRVRTTLGQAFRRVMLQRATSEQGATAVPATNDGKGVCFISHMGELYPSGFLPIRCGNVRRDSLRQVYWSHPVFQALRDARRLKGKCGRCPFNVICGGCRARAYACSGDYLEADQSCLYQPIGQQVSPSGPPSRVESEEAP